VIWRKVIKGIDAANKAGFRNTKLNCVVMKGRNDHEINDLVSFAIDRNLDISFIEEMPLGTIDEHSRAESFFSSAQVRERIAERYTLIELRRVDPRPVALLATGRSAADSPGVHFAPQPQLLRHLQSGAADRGGSTAAVPGQ
jgi:molybdenum cofactor biosynthesis enzyme MoaA